MYMAELKKSIREYKLARHRVEKIAKKAYEQLRSTSVQCNEPRSYQGPGAAEWIDVGKKGTISIGERDKKFEYFTIFIPKRYEKKIDNVMKNLRIERCLFATPCT